MIPTFIKILVLFEYFTYNFYPQLKSLALNNSLMAILHFSFDIQWHIQESENLILELEIFCTKLETQNHAS